jgi:hypothetical protein
MVLKNTMLATLVVLLSPGGLVAAEEAVLVEKGAACSVRDIGAEWMQKDGVLVGSDVDNFLVAGKVAGAGEFGIRARLSLERLDGFLVFGQNHFGLTDVAESCPWKVPRWEARDPWAIRPP